MGMSSARAKILIIDDDRKLSEAVAAGGDGAGYEVLTAGSAEEGFFLIHNQHPDLLILDLTLPQRTGLDLLQQLRSEGTDVRVLILTSHNTIDDRVTGLRLGADDYLGKPFSFPELLARIDVQLRRTVPAQTAAMLQVADLCVDAKKRMAMRDGQRLELTVREFDLLLYLVENRGRTVSREMLARDIWHETSRFTPIDNVIDVQVARLRRKIDDPFGVKLLQTVRGLGFTLREPEV
ncbi:DNA-binding response regulator [Silvibacterium dinghuense]|nr:response regulator transcription factor [Silvibacterium dinghuense]GGH11432.1 DNA-binding response regulator [Silvibacterium dinghuense]